jgi:peptidoglycan DL-endopeptidase CwlO
MNAAVAWTPSVPVPARVTEIRARLAPAARSSEAPAFDAALADAQALVPGNAAPARSAATFGSAQGAYARPAALGRGLTGAYTATAAGGDAVPAALEYVGVPYVWGGNDPATGLDCSGFTKLVFGSLGVNLPRVSTDQATMGTPVASLAEARPGDLLAFGSPVDHVAIYLGDGRMVHAAGTGKGVRVDDVYRQPTAIRRLLPSATGSISGTPSARGDASTYAPLFAAAGDRHGVDPALLSAVARAESGYNPNAMSTAGARGLMQFMPDTAAGLGIDPLDPAQAIDGAARYLAQQLTTFGSVDLALAAYNAGPVAVTRYGGVPPFAETQSYVTKVLAYRDEARAMIGASA